MRAAEALPVKVVSPPYTAVIEWEPAERAAVVKLAIPPESVPAPSVAAPSLKVTVPVGVPEPDAGLSVALNVTDWPTTDGFGEEIEVVVVETLLTT